jgi:hypothetical protein
MTMALVDLEVEIDRIPAEIKLARFVAIEKPSDADGRIIRIDICVSQDGEPTLNKIVVKSSATPFTAASYLEIVPEYNSEQPGFKDFVFGDYSKLNLRFLAPDSQHEYRFGGLEQDNHPFVYFAEGDIVDSILVANSIIAGSAEEKNPFADIDGQVCGSGEKHLRITETVPLPEGKIAVIREICQRFEFGTFKENLIKVIVTNSSVQIADAEKEISVTNFSDLAAVPYFGRNTVHHNVCTSWLVKLPYGTFGYTRLVRAGNIGGGKGLMGCPSLVEGAPEVPRTTGRENSVLRYTLTGQLQVSVTAPNIEVQEIPL